jgi:hypothetical protein
MRVRVWAMQQRGVREICTADVRASLMVTSGSGGAHHRHKTRLCEGGSGGRLEAADVTDVNGGERFEIHAQATTK